MLLLRNCETKRKFIEAYINALPKRVGIAKENTVTKSRKGVQFLSIRFLLNNWLLHVSEVATVKQ